MGSEVIFASELPLEQSYVTNVPCVQKRIMVRKPAPFTQPEYFDGCWYESKIGLIEKQGQYVVPDGHEMAGLLVLDSGRDDDRRVRFYQTENENVLAHGYYDGVNTRIKYRDINTVQLSPSVALSGTMTIGATFSDETNGSVTPSSVDKDSHFSEDSDWMVSVGDGWIRRFNFKDLNGYVLTQVNPPLSGRNRDNHAAIADGGRYASMSINETQASLKLIDFEACGFLKDSRMTTMTSCPGTEIKSLVNTAAGFTSNAIAAPRFIGTSIIEAWTRNPTTGNYHNFYVYAPGADTSARKYLALGDSFASGEGAYNYVNGTDVSSNKCHLSQSSYPYLFESNGSVDEMHSLACSGAKIGDISGEVDKVQFPSAIERGEDGFISWLPGRNSQLKERNEENYEPSVVTVSISGNDIKFADKIKSCVMSSTSCFDTYAQRRAIVLEINRQHDRLVDLYAQIKDASMPGVKIYAIGYPQIASALLDGEECGVNVRLSDSERVMAYDLVGYFNAVIKHAAATADVHYVSVESALSGHRLCDVVPDRKLAVNGLTAGNDAALIIGKESYHPNQLGHELLYDAVQTRTDSLTLYEPLAPNDFPDANNYPFLTDRADDGTAVIEPFAMNLLSESHESDLVYYKGDSLPLSIDGMRAPTLANANYSVALHSDPIDLGTIITNGIGGFSGAISLPSDLEPGLHTLHITGPGVAGGEVDLYQYIYVGVTPGDFFGDGIPDAQQPCGALGASGLDSDQDGTDDACDPEIGLPPEPDPQPEPDPDPPPEEEPSKPFGQKVRELVAELKEIAYNTVMSIKRIGQDIKVQVHSLLEQRRIDR